MFSNHYKALGISKTATQAEIKKEYYKLAVKYHPDKPTGNATKFKEISNAYSTIGNEDKRKNYDSEQLYGDDNFGQSQRQQQQRQQQPWQSQHQAYQDFSGFNQHQKQRQSQGQRTEHQQTYRQTFTGRDGQKYTYTSQGGQDANREFFESFFGRSRDAFEKQEKMRQKREGRSTQDKKYQESQENFEDFWKKFEQERKERQEEYERMYQQTGGHQGDFDPRVPRMIARFFKITMWILVFQICYSIFFKGPRKRQERLEQEEAYMRQAQRQQQERKGRYQGDPNPYMGNDQGDIYTRTLYNQAVGQQIKEDQDQAYYDATQSPIFKPSPSHQNPGQAQIIKDQYNTHLAENRQKPSDRSDVYQRNQQVANQQAAYQGFSQNRQQNQGYQHGKPMVSMTREEYIQKVKNDDIFTGGESVGGMSGNTLPPPVPQIHESQFGKMHAAQQQRMRQQGNPQDISETQRRPSPQQLQQNPNYQAEYPGPGKMQRQYQPQQVRQTQMPPPQQNQQPDERQFQPQRPQ